MMSHIGTKLIPLNREILSHWGWGENSPGPGMMWGWWGMGWIFMVVFWGILIVGMILVIRWLIGITKGTKVDESPLDILKKRYARGEINKDEFEQRKKDLL